MTQKLSLDEFKNIAKERGGKCLSKKYVNIDTKLKWECSKGHVWFNTPYHIKNRGQWCRVCKGYGIPTLTEFKNIAKERGGKCLSKKYIRSDIKLKWQCSKGHVWQAVPNTIKNTKSWCPFCGGTKRLTIEEMQTIAKKRGGKCLSKKYINASTKLEWQCSDGHKWKARPNDIKINNQWCPRCFFYYKEELCRTTFEQLFNKKFPKLKPNWLINSRNNKMELDGYCKRLNLAFEYQGEQHFHKSSFYSNDINQRVVDDLLKRKLCKKKVITLVIINYKNDLLDLPKIIKRKLEKSNIKTKNINFDKKIDFNKVYKNKSYLKIANDIANKKGGKCLSSKYLDKQSNLKWKCSNNHIWIAPLGRLIDGINRVGSWCPECAGVKKLSLEEMQKIAKSKNGKCLSNKYISGHLKLKWQCSKGHEWQATALSVKHNSWCPFCAGRKKLTIEEMQKIAKSKNGKCLSKKYINARTKLEWQCSKKHKWLTTPDIIRRGHWCPKCWGRD